MWWKSEGKINNDVSQGPWGLALKEEGAVDAGTLSRVWLGDGGTVGSGVDGGRHCSGW